MRVAPLIPATLSFIPPGMDHACTVCLHHGTDYWRKTYRSQTLAQSEARTLGLLTSSVGEFVGVFMIDTAELKQLGFHKQSE